MHTKYKTSFKRSLLPDPSQYYRQQGVQLKGGSAWKSGLCPFHNDNTPSLRVHLNSGAFRCMACGAHGGDIVAFHQLRYQIKFTEAAQDLGAWRTR